MAELGARACPARRHVIHLDAATAKMVCWGERALGRIGNGSPTSGDSETPTAVSTIKNALTVVAAVHHGCATTSTDTVYCWGHHVFGKLGDGTSSDRSTPVAVVSLP